LPKETAQDEEGRRKDESYLLEKKLPALNILKGKTGEGRSGTSRKKKHIKKGCDGPKQSVLRSNRIGMQEEKREREKILRKRITTRREENAHILFLGVIPL